MRFNKSLSFRSAREKKFPKIKSLLFENTLNTMNERRNNNKLYIMGLDI